MSISINTALLEKSFLEISANFNNQLTVSVETHYVDHLSGDRDGIYVSMGEEIGMFLVQEEKFLTFLPKYDGGDSSVGLSGEYYHGFECHGPDMEDNDLLNAVLTSYTTLLKFNLKPQLYNLLEHEALLIAEEKNKTEKR